MARPTVARSTTSARFVRRDFDFAFPKPRARSLLIYICRLSGRTGTRAADVYASALRHGRSRRAARSSLAGLNPHHLWRGDSRLTMAQRKNRRQCVYRTRARRRPLRFRSAALRFIQRARFLEPDPRSRAPIFARLHQKSRSARAGYKTASHNCVAHLQPATRQRKQLVEQFCLGPKSRHRRGENAVVPARIKLSARSQHGLCALGARGEIRPRARPREGG